MSFNFEKDRFKHIHFIGIGGISMSGLAEILLDHGYRVSGSDAKSSNITEHLMKKGASIYIGQREENIKDVDLVVYTAAISDDNPELLKAKEKNILLMDRAEFLGYLMKDFKYNVAIAGTHGKTTTTSMISHIVLNAELDPTILVGGELDAINGNVRSGHSEYFVTEACEYKASFLKFYPYIGVILNIEADHLDYYRDIEHIKETFASFIKLIPDDGYLVAWAEDDNVREVLPNAQCKVLTYGLENGSFTARNITFNDRGCATFDICKDGSELFRVSLNVPGKHNVLNALASAATALSLNIQENKIINGLASFYGTHRRFELKGNSNGVVVIDDYAHHPTEIKATLSAAKNYPHKRIVCVFQPHTYTRTKTLFQDFSEAFLGVDELLLAEIYAAREKDTGEVSSLMLGNCIREKGQNCKNFHSFEEIVKYLNASLKEGDLLLTVGAGDVYRIGEMYLNK